MSQLVRITSDSPWEQTVGYSRAVRVGHHVYVSGTTAVDSDGRVRHPGNAYAQACRIFRTIARALDEAGASMADVVRTRMYVVDMAAHSEAVGRAHAEQVGTARPAATMIEVSGLINPAMLVEIEVEAYCADP